jgi:peptidoglycan-associated lipoprotein
MKKHSLLKMTVIGASALALVACSSHRGHGSSVSDGGMGNDGMGGTGGAYTQGLGGEAGYAPSTSCNVPQTPGMNTQAYYFDYDSASVHPEDQGRLQNLAQNITSSHSNVKVVGNTDDRGSREYNMALGWKRANDISSNLQQHGVSKSQIITSSNGAEKPIAVGSSEDDYQCNRRVDALYH